MKVNRQQLLRGLEKASVGLSKWDDTEQGGCFIFAGGKVTTHNDEVVVVINSPLEIDGAVQAGPLMLLLRKLIEDELEIDITEKGLRIKGKSRRAVIRMEQGISSAAWEIEEPNKWRKIPDGLLDAIKMAMLCCSSDKAHFLLSCVHIADDRVEASDDFQIICCPIKTGLHRPTQLRKESVATLVNLELTEWDQSENWLHFRDMDGMVLSCRRYMEEYPDISRHLEIVGSEAKLPSKGIESALDKVQIFSSDEVGGNYVTVELRKGRLRLEGRGQSGSYQEIQKVEYDGPDISFKIEPRLLLEIGKLSDICVIGDTKIKVETDKFTYVSCTSPVEK